MNFIIRRYFGNVNMFKYLFFRKIRCLFVYGAYSLTGIGMPVCQGDGSIDILLRNW